MFHSARRTVPRARSAALLRDLGALAMIRMSTQTYLDSNARLFDKSVSEGGHCFELLLFLLLGLVG